MTDVQAGLFSTQLPVTNEEVNVYTVGTTSAAQLYTDAISGVTAANPVETDALGNLAFYAAPGNYDICYVRGDVKLRQTATVGAPPATEVPADESRTVTTSATIQAGDAGLILVCNATESIAVTLPSGLFTYPATPFTGSVPADGFIPYGTPGVSAFGVIKNSGAGVVVVAGDGTSVINGTSAGTAYIRPDGSVTWGLTSTNSYEVG
jgi:hypothetical protein